ncbi:MAG: hypothetical protein N3A55_09185 [Methylohalobius sp.]|nr:hypothetical protein [Methylohalobius sp.]
MADQDPTKSYLRGAIVWMDQAVLVVLVLLSLGGLAISAFAIEDDYLYWLAMIPVFGLGAILSSWSQARRTQSDETHNIKRLLWIELLHWGGTLAAVIGVFLLRYLQALNDPGAALVMLLILALSTYLNGIRIGWRFSLLGAFLGIAAILTAYVERFLPVATLLAIALILFSFHQSQRKPHKTSSHGG